MNLTKQFFKYVSQNIFGLLGTSCYILADTYFISQAAGTDGVTTLKTLGFRHVTTDTVPSEMQGLIIEVRVNGRSVEGGTKAALNSKIVVSIGDGSVDAIEFDPLGSQRDSLIKQKIKSGEFQIITDSLGNTRLVPRSKR